MGEPVDDVWSAAADDPTGGNHRVSALAAAWPRAVIAQGRAEELARWWIAQRRSAHAAGGPPFPRIALSAALQQAIFDARRARNLERGLEGAESRLASEEAGIDRVPEGSAGDRPSRSRISRLLIVSGDGSERFYRRVEKIHQRFSKRLEVLLVEADEFDLGASAYGRGRKARALLLTHKDAVSRFLDVLARVLREDGRMSGSGRGAGPHEP